MLDRVGGAHKPVRKMKSKYMSTMKLQPDERECEAEAESDQ